MKTYNDLQNDYSELQRKFDLAREKKDVNEMLRLIKLMEDNDRLSKIMLLARMSNPYILGTM